LTGTYDIAIAGSGFAGSLMAIIAKRLGYSVALIERGTHPRVVIGESSTPLANLLFEELCQRYDLRALAPLAKWGRWQHTYPQVACGLKRGFTFYHHSLGEKGDPAASFETQLLVAASPHDEIADTQWYRADVDAFLVEHARQLDVDYFDETQIENVECSANGIRLAVSRHGSAFSLSARFVVDATGPRGLLHRALRLSETELPCYLLTQALWSHFEGVTRPADTPLGMPPYPPEDAAVHHVFDGGWIWVLRFNNGITSAGVAATDAVAAELGFSEGESAWHRLVEAMPALQRQFSHARAVLPFRLIPRLSFLNGQAAGDRWALLPSAAGFVDPLLSTGFPLTLLGVERVARILEAGLESPRLGVELLDYERRTRDEILVTARLIGALYANMSNFAVFRALTLLYFAAASYSETARRLHKPQLAQSFLLHDHPTFGPAMRAILECAMLRPQGADATQLIEDIRRTIEPIDVAGLSKPNAQNWYPVDAEDLLNGCAKVESTRVEIESLLQRCGFFPAGQLR
jgi:tetracycline 7-halogenase / FADH2 O2-dependent halogenase